MKFLHKILNSINNFLDEHNLNYLAFFSKKDSEKKHDEEFISDTKAALLTRTTPLANRIIIVVASFFIVGFIWAAFAKIDEITVGEGKVIPSSQVKIIQSLDGGILLNMSVQEGEIVKKGQVLVKLDDTRYKADYEQGEQKYLALLALVARLTAETQQKNTIDFPEELRKGHEELIAREIKLFQQRKEGLKSELGVLQNSYDLATKELNIYEPLVKKGIVPKIEFYRSQRTANDLKRNMLQIQDKFREDSLTELNQHKAELSTLNEQLVSLRDKMQDTTLRSPVYGVVKKIYIVTIGGVIQPGAPIMEVVPLADTLLIEAHVRPSDIAFVHVGQNATVKISAYDYSIYGSLPGKVEYISADAIEETKQPNQERTLPSYYIIHVRTQKNYLGSEKHKLPIIPGMNATVHIMTGKKTILQYILKPLLKAKEEALRER